jgi:hypothetical protein
LRAGGGEADREARRAFLDAVLARARDLHEALARMPDTPCPARVALIGGETLPTLARAIVSDRPGDSPRFVSSVPAEAEAMFEAGDGRVTRASMLAAHLPGADEDEHGCGVPEVSRIFLGAADHHGIYADPTFQTVLLRQLLKPHRRRETAKVG